MFTSNCIICLQDHTDQTVEHIVPRSLGNIHYVLPKGRVCRKCNQRFSKYEYQVLNNESWLIIRVKRGLARQDALPLSRPLKEADLFKFLLKMFYESMYYSRQSVFDIRTFEPLRLALTGKSTLGFEIYEQKTLNDAKSIPNWINKWRLSRNSISLSYRIGPQYLYFYFGFDIIHTVLAINRS